MHRKHSPSSRKGVTLILALMVMSAVIAIGITIVAIVVFQTRINVTAIQGQQGYYAAESGVEQALSKVVGLRSGSLSLAEGAIRDSQAPAYADGTVPLSFNLDLTTAVTSGTVVQKELKQNQSAIVELFDVDNSLQNLTDEPVLCVYGEGSGDEVLEISWVAWKNGNPLPNSQVQRVLAGQSAFSTGSCDIDGISYSGFRVPLNLYYPAFTGPYAGFRVRITALAPSNTPNAGDVSNLTIRSYPSLNSHLRIKSTSRGEFANQQQSLLAVVPWSVPLSSLFDFVIFSEKSITKDKPQSKSDEIRTFGPYAGPATWGDAALPDSIVNDANVNPFQNCGTSQCQYYVRVINSTAFVQNYGVDMRLFNQAPQGVQNALGLAPGASCILPRAYTFTTGGHPPSPTIQIQFGAAAQYQLLTHPTYKDPTEGPCTQ